MGAKMILAIFLVVVLVALVCAMVLLGSDLLPGQTVQPSGAKPGDSRYCESASDCVTSCGREIGRGSCYNKAYTTEDNPIDNVCCFCENCAQCMSCECIDNTCTARPTQNACC